MENIKDFSVKDALERLSLPVFYSDDERMEAYYIIMEFGNSIEKVIAEKVVGVYPLEEFSSVHAQSA